LTSDLPTPITCKSGGFEKQAQKNLEIKDLKPGDFKNMRQSIKPTTTDYFFQSTLYLISTLCCTLLPLFCTFCSGVLVRQRSSGGGEDSGRTKTLKAGDKLVLMNFIRLL